MKDFNRLPVKVDTCGGVWLEGGLLNCALVLPFSSRGELVFKPSDTFVLMGPWGPDPSTHLIVPACVETIGTEVPLARLNLRLPNSGKLLSVCVLSKAAQALCQGRKVWLSVPLGALDYNG